MHMVQPSIQLLSNDKYETWVSGEIGIKRMGLLASKQEK